MLRQAGRVLLFGYDYVVLYLGLIWLGVMCLAWTPIALIANPVLPSRWGRALGRYATMGIFRIYLGSLRLTRRCYFDLEALDTLRHEPALILAPNHPSMLDAVMIISRLPNVACVLKANLMNNLFLGAGARLARYIRNDPVRRMVHIATEDIAGGSHLLLFPEGTRTIVDPVNQLKGSIALISHHAAVPVQTILIETDTRYLSKGWPLFRKPPMPIHFRVRLGRRFAPPEHSHEFMTELENYFSHELVQGSAFFPRHTLPQQPDRQLS